MQLACNYAPGGKAGLARFMKTTFNPAMNGLQVEKHFGTMRSVRLLIGKDGVQRWVGAEYHVALRRHYAKAGESESLPIFPVLLEDTQSIPLPAFLSSFQSVRWDISEPLPPQLIAAIQSRATRNGNAITFEGRPFLGLSAFGRQHAPLFFGRRQETLRALEGLGDQHRIVRKERSVATAKYSLAADRSNSGSGKPSLVNAGMLPLSSKFLAGAHRFCEMAHP